MKKAVHLLVDKFDILLQNRLKLVLAKQIKDEVDQRMRTLRQLSQAKVLCSKCKSVQASTTSKPKNCSTCLTDLKIKSPTVKQIRTKVRERVDRSIEHHHQRLQSPRTRGTNGNKYPYKSPNRWFESQESSIRSVEDLQYSIETSPANTRTRSPNRHKIHAPIADASFCSSDKVRAYGHGPAHLGHHFPPCQEVIREKGPKKPATSRLPSKDSKAKKSKQDASANQKVANGASLQNRSRNSFATAPKSGGRANDGSGAKKTKEPKSKRQASKASAGGSQARHANSKKSNDALKLRQDEYVEKLPIGYPMELKDDLIDSRLKWLANTQQVSALFDEIDEIYKEQDPIEESLVQRKKHNGFINNYSVVRTKGREKRKFFFYLRSKLPEQNSIFEVSPVQLMSQLRRHERAEAIRVIDESYHQRNPNIMLPQSSNSSSRVKISGSQSTQKIDRSGQNSIISQQNTSINNDYRPIISSAQAKQTFTDSRKYSDSEKVEKLPSGQPVKRKPDQMFKQAFQQEKKYQAKSIPGSPDRAPIDCGKVIEQPSPDKWVVLDQSSQDALKDIKLAHSFEKSADPQISVDQNLLSPMKSQLNSPDQKFAINTISDNSGMIAPISPIDYPLHPVYSPEKHPQMQHALIQQQSPEKIHFETFEEAAEEHEPALQLAAAGSVDERKKECQQDDPARTPQKSPKDKKGNQEPRKDELISESLPESPQVVPQQNELKELERETPFNYHSQDGSLDISRDRELVESHTPLNSQMQSHMTNNAPPSTSPMKPGRADQLSSTVYRMNAKEVEERQDQERQEGRQEVHEAQTAHHQSSPKPVRSRSRRGSPSPKQSSPSDAKQPAREKSSSQHRSDRNLEAPKGELVQSPADELIVESQEAPPAADDQTQNNCAIATEEEQTKDDQNSKGNHINSEITEQQSNCDEDPSEPPAQDRKMELHQDHNNHKLEKSIEKPSETNRPKTCALEQDDFVLQASSSVLNTVQALERALNQVKVKHPPSTLRADGQVDNQRILVQHQADTPEQVQVLNSKQTIHKSLSPRQEQPIPQTKGLKGFAIKNIDDEDAQLKKIMDQFEVLNDRQTDQACRLSQMPAAPEFIDENEIDEAINEVLESQSLNFNQGYNRQASMQDESDQSASDLSLSTNHKAMQLDNFQERFVTQIIQPFQDDQIEDIKIEKALNEGQSSGVVSIFQEMEKGKLLVETSPRKAHGQHHIEFENHSRDSPPDNPKTSPRQYQVDNMGIIENLAKAGKAHTRQASALPLGQAPANSGSATPFGRGADVTQKTHQTAFTEILPLLYKNAFIRDLGQESMMKLAAEMQKVVFNKGDQIVRYGDISQNYYVLHKGKIKVTEYEPSTSPHDLDLDNKITLVKYINKEGHGFGEESVKNFTPLKASIDAIEHCEFYVLDGFLINEILTKVSQDRMSSIKDHQRQKNILRRLSERELISEEQAQTSSSGLSKQDEIRQPTLNFVPESFLTDSASSRHRMRAASHGPAQAEHDDLLTCDLSAIRQKDQPSISASSSSVSPNLNDMAYASFIEYDDSFGLCLRELALFGDRAPSTHVKVRVLSKNPSQLYWITSSDQGQLYIAVQIPRCLPNLPSRVRMLQAEQEFYNSIRHKKDIQKYLFPFEGVLSHESSPDVWQLYRMDQRKDAYRSLFESLFEVTFDQRMATSKMFDIQHSALYSLVAQRKGRRHLAKLIKKICEFLVQVQETGIIYGNLRPENILIRFDDEQKEIQQIKFVDFGSTTRIEKASDMLMPDRLDHFPPDLLKQFVEMEKFEKGHRQTAEQLRSNKKKVSEMSESVSVYSLGMILLQITAGCPMQMQLPLRCRIKTIKGEQQVGAPPFGVAPAEPVRDNDQVKQLIQIQDTFLSNLRSFLQKNDPYKFTQDDDFSRLLQSMLHKDHSKRPKIREVMNDRFVKKWTKH